MITYKGQFDKLTSAYIRNEINPYAACGCFVGNLLNKTSSWICCRSNIGHASNIMDIINLSDLDFPCGEEGRESYITSRIRDFNYGLHEIKREGQGFYTHEDIIALEEKFMSYFDSRYISQSMQVGDEYERMLFNAFEATLEMLKSIHEAKGEIIDQEPQFIKRKLETV